jgi:hypothetical protein
MDSKETGRQDVDWTHLSHETDTVKYFEHVIETLGLRSALGHTVGAGMSFPQCKAAWV